LVYVGYTGTRQIAFGAWFDADGYNWHWNTDKLMLSQRPDAEGFLVMSHSTLARSFFSVFKAEEGCDGRPKSQTYKVVKRERQRARMSSGSACACVRACMRRALKRLKTLPCAPRTKHQNSSKAVAKQ